MNGSKLTMAFLGVMIALAMAFPVSAGTIVNNSPSGSGGGTATVTPIITTFPGNDDASVPGGNIVVASKIFKAPIPLDIVFDVVPSNGLVTEYFVAEGVANNAGIAVIVYTFELGFGRGGDYERSASGDGLDFDWPGSGAVTGMTPVPTSGVFSTLVHGEDLIVWSGGSLDTIEPDAFTLSIDVPDLADHNNQFTLRQWGTPVPEPGTLALAALIGCALTAFGMRKRLG